MIAASRRDFQVFLNHTFTKNRKIFPVFRKCMFKWSSAREEDVPISSQDSSLLPHPSFILSSCILRNFEREGSAKTDPARKRSVLKDKLMAIYGDELEAKTTYHHQNSLPNIICAGIKLGLNWDKT